MNKDNSKIITVSFVIAAVIVAIVASVLFQTFAAAFGPVARLYSQDVFRHGLPITLGLLTLASLALNKNVKLVADEVVTETRKVVWASRKDVTAMTIVTTIMLAISSAILIVFDFVSTEAVKMLLS